MGWFKRIFKCEERPPFESELLFRSFLEPYRAGDWSEATRRALEYVERVVGGCRIYKPVQKAAVLGFLRVDPSQPSQMILRGLGLRDESEQHLGRPE